MNQQFTNKETEIANTQIYSASLVVKEMKIKSVLPIRLAEI